MGLISKSVSRGRVKRRAAAVTLFFAVLGGSAFAGAAGDGNKDRLVALLGPAVTGWKERLGRLRGDFRIQIKPASSAANPFPSRREGSFWVSGGRYKFTETESTARTRKPETLIYITTVDGTATLLAKPGQEIPKVENWDDSDVVRSAVWRGFWDLLESPFAMMGMTVVQILQFPGSVVEIPDHEDAWTRGEVQVPIKITTAKGDVYELTMDPKKALAIVRSKLFSHQLGDRVLWDASIEYEGSGDVLLPKRVLLHDYMGRDRTCEFSNLVRESQPDGFFTPEYHKVAFRPSASPSARELLESETGHPATRWLTAVLILSLGCFGFLAYRWFQSTR